MPGAYRRLYYLLLTSVPVVRTYPPIFVLDLHALDESLTDAKMNPCPHCHRAGMVIGHGLLVGYAEFSSDRVTRGRRFLCSNRFRRSGCGRTFSVWLSTVLAGFTVRTPTMSRMFHAVIGGLCIKAAWEKDALSGLTPHSGYRLWHRLLVAQSRLRSMLCDRAPPPPCNNTQPLAQLLSHLQQVLGPTDCLFAGFQLTFQRHLLG